MLAMKIMIKYLTLLSLILGLATVSCVSAKKKSLFDGKSFAGWETGGGEPVSEGWEIQDGAIYRSSKGGHIYTTAEYENFELEFEWKVAEGTNSGVKYRVKLFGKSLLGPEFQVLDDANHSNGKNPVTSAASFYALFAPAETKTLKPLGEYNHSKIVARGTILEHWLNGEKVISVDMNSEIWKERVAASKFKKLEGYGVGAGKIMLQDHGDEVWFRNITIKELK